MRWIKVGVPVLISLSVSCFFVLRLTQEYRIRIENSKISELKSKNRLLVENIWSSVDLLRLKSLNLKNSHNTHALKEAGILYWALLNLKPSGSAVVKSSRAGLQWKGFTQAEHYLKSMLQRLDVRRLREQGITLLRVKQNPFSSAEWLAFAFTHPELKEEAILALVNPQEIFPGFSRYSIASGSSAHRAFLLSSDGMVLAHTSSSYVGSSFRELPGFLEIALAAKRDGSERGDLRLAAVDRNPVALSYSRLGALPLVVVSERVLDTPSLNGFFWNWKMIVVVLTLGIFIYGFLFALGYFVQSLLKKKLPIRETPVEAPESLPVASPIQNQFVERQMSQFLEVQEALDIERKNHVMLGEFEKEIFPLREPERMTKRLTEVTAILCKSPVLFFVYKHEISAAILQSFAGFDEGQNPTPMSFVIKEELLSQVQNKSTSGEITSVTQYEPLVNIIMARMGVAHFDAWAIAGFGPLGRQSGKVRLLGILVNLHSGVDSQLHQDALNRLMRSTGLIYENVLLSQ